MSLTTKIADGSGVENNLENNVENNGCIVTKVHERSKYVSMDDLEEVVENISDKIKSAFHGDCEELLIDPKIIIKLCKEVGCNLPFRFSSTYKICVICGTKSTRQCSNEYCINMLCEDSSSHDTTHCSFYCKEQIIRQLHRSIQKLESHKLNT
jgi:hypothetical protein